MENGVLKCFVASWIRVEVGNSAIGLEGPECPGMTKQRLAGQRTTLSRILRTQ